MNNELKITLKNKYKPRTIKWLFGGNMPKNIPYIYEGLPDDYILHFEQQIEDKKWDEYNIDEMIRHWKYTVAWIKEFNNLINKPFRKKYTQCMVETKQEYRNFNKDDLEDVIKYYGLAANHLYSASRDIFYSCPVLNRPKYEPLNLYYQLSLEYLMWNFATFVQDKKSCSFVDFYTQFKRMMRGTENAHTVKN